MLTKGRRGGTLVRLTVSGESSYQGGVGVGRDHKRDAGKILNLDSCD